MEEEKLDFDVICDYYTLLDRQGPGSDEITQKALSFIPTLNENSKIADIGCGTGGQTLTLAKHTQGMITALDLFPKFIDSLTQRTQKSNLDHRITGQVGNMENMPFKEEELDLIWSEGAIYNIGFEKGLNTWKKYLKEEGFLAVTEISWITKERPAEIEEYWKREYPEIDSISNKVAQIEKANYSPIATFILPEECWTENYYAQESAIEDDFLRKYPNNETAKEWVKREKDEIKLYKQYKEYYGYVFYICQKKK